MLSSSASKQPKVYVTVRTGIIQLARSPLVETCRPPNIVRSTCPPLIMPKLTSLENTLEPGRRVTVCLPEERR